MLRLHVLLLHCCCTVEGLNWLAAMQAGHALAAASEGIGVQNVGAFTLLLLPGAYVALDSGALATLGPWRTLRVRLASPAACYMIVMTANHGFQQARCMQLKKVHYSASFILQQGGFMCCEELRDPGRSLCNRGKNPVRLPMCIPAHNI